MAGREHWLTIARGSNPDDLRESILSGYKTGKPFTPYVPTIALPSPLEWTLDFGCGIGRNFPFLKTRARRVAGFDLEPMIERCRALATDEVELLTAHWEEVTSRRFDLIFASLVLQHIEPEVYRSYLLDFARISPALYVLTRIEDDFGSNVLRAIAETGLFDAGVCVEVDHDPDIHQLRVLGRKSLTEAWRGPQGAHYETLLRSKVFVNESRGG
ncbi:MAG TPA: class I SAM-dependent methyltransferase [Pyrinomonadaceae bacterium]|nr:class I SAM-dependent methyltransferase [Pyrinomonadaceae bacterium]